MAYSRTSRAVSVRDPPAAGRPQAGDRTTDDVRHGDGAEIARVLGDPAVVAHDEDRARRHADGPEVDAVLRPRVRVRLADRAAVDDEQPVLEADGVAAERHDALEQDLVTARSVERDELAAVRRTAAGDLLDERLVAPAQRRLHALPGGLERLGEA